MDTLWTITARNIEIVLSVQTAQAKQGNMRPRRRQKGGQRDCPCRRGDGHGNQFESCWANQSPLACGRVGGCGGRWAEQPGPRGQLGLDGQTSSPPLGPGAANVPHYPLQRPWTGLGRWGHLEAIHQGQAAAAPLGGPPGLIHQCPVGCWRRLQDSNGFPCGAVPRARIGLPLLGEGTGQSARRVVSVSQTPNRPDPARSPVARPVSVSRIGIGRWCWGHLGVASVTLRLFRMVRPSGWSEGDLRVHLSHV